MTVYAHFIVKKINFQSRMQLNLLPFVLCFHLIESLSSVKPLPIRFYEHEKIETGSQTVLFSDDTFGSLQFNHNYVISLQRLKLQNRADYLFTTSFRSLQLSLANPGQYYINWQEWGYTTSSTFTIRIYSVSQNDFTSAKFNYIVFSRTFWEQGDIICNQLTTYNPADPSLPVCDGRTTKATCRFEQTYLLSTLGYRLFYHIISFYTHITRTTPQITFYTLKVEILSTTKIAISYTAEYILFYYITCDIILIKNELFDTTTRKRLMFSSIYFTEKVTSGTSYTFFHSFSHKITHTNLFIGIIGHKGNEYDYQIGPNSTPDYSLLGTINGAGYFGQFYAIAIYGYISQCPTHMKMPCSRCPPYCITCDVAPTFHCVECEQNFYVAPDQQSCLCPPPLSIVGDFCNKFPFGCNVAELQPNGIPQCVSCDLYKKLEFDGSTCLCKNGFAFDSNNVCQQICGDGQVFQSECDDGNTVSGDGCSSTCFLEIGSGLARDKSIIPAICKSEIFLKYRVKTILKGEHSNSVQITLEVQNSQFLPFPVKLEHFDPIFSYITLEITTDEKTGNKVAISNLILKSITSSNELILTFDYTFHLEETRGQLYLNYAKTLYKKETQKLNFIIKGDNYALKYDGNSEAYKSMGTGMMVQTILNLILLLIGLISPKFIGLESILTLQLIFYSQFLIMDVSKVPPGFVFLKSLKYASGYNDILELTSLSLQSAIAKKMNLLGIRKLAIENFNINFLILTLGFIALAIVSFLVNMKMKAILDQNSSEKPTDFKNGNQIQKITFSQDKIRSLKLYSKIQQKVFPVSNQISFWLILPIISAFSGQLLILNKESFFIKQDQSTKIFFQLNGQIILLSLMMIVFIGMNNFENLWLGLHTFNKLSERPEEIKYKATLFVYLFVIGFSIFFFNQFDFFYLHGSVIVFLIQGFYLITLVKIDPYRQSLRIHNVCLIFSNVLLLFIWLLLI